MANKKDPPKKKYKDINKYLPDFSSAASTTSTNKSPILSSAKIKQDVKKLENDEAAKKLLKSNPTLGFKGKVPESDKVDYRYTNSQSKSYSGNPNMAFVRAGKTGTAGKMAEDNFNIETLGAILPLAGKAGRASKVTIPKSKFKSEINWSKWNKEIPSNKVLLNEYKAIEQQAKANNNWMKYSDGSKFKGTPEQFVQMNSKNAIDFAGGDLNLSEQMYKQDLHRGSRQHITDFANRDLNDRTATFLTDSKKNAETYAGSDGLEKTYHHPDVNVHPGYDPTNKSLPLNYEDGIYQLGFPQNSKKVIAEAKGNNWRFLDYDKKIDPDKFRAELNKSNFEYNLNDKKQYRFDYPEDFNINKDYLSTDDYATYIKNNNNPEGIAQINNVKDQMGRAEGIPSNTVYAIDANKVPIKSLRYNNGMFDITNPNIYKAVVPAAIGGTGLIQQAQGSNPEQYATGGFNNNNNNSMIKEFNGDSHSNPSEGIKYGNILVEDGELEHNGYIFSKDANETKEAKKQMNKRSLRTDENGYVWDGISRKSLEPKMKNLAMSHERNRLSEEYDNMAQNEIGMLPNFGGTAGGRMKYATGGFTPVEFNTPQMITNQQPVNNFTVSGDAAGPNTPMSPTGNRQGKSGMSMGQAAGYANAIGGLASTLGQFAPDDPYAKEGVGKKETGTQIAESTTDTVMSAIPFVGQFYGAGKGLSSGIESGRDDARSKGDNFGAEAAAWGAGTVDPMGSAFDIGADWDNGVISTGDAIGANILNFIAFGGVGGAGDAALESKRRDYYENQKQKKEAEMFNKNRRIGNGTMQAPNEERNRLVAGKGGPRRMYETGGEKPKLNYNNFNPNFQPYKDPMLINRYKYSPNLLPEATVSGGQSGVPQYMTPRELSRDNKFDLPAMIDTSLGYPNAKVNDTTVGSKERSKVDFGGIGESIAMGLLSNAGNFAYLADQGKDYDKVDYGSYNPRLQTATSALRRLRETTGSQLARLKDSGKLDTNSLALIGTQGGQSIADVQEQINNMNNSILNDAQIKKIELGRLGQDATAQNKGQALSNYYAALSGIGENMQNAYGNYNLRNADAERVAQNKIKNDWISRQMELTFGKNS